MTNLLIDDRMTDLRAVEVLNKNQGEHRPKSHTSTAEALSRRFHQVSGQVIFDCMMPNLYGLRRLQAFRRFEACDLVPALKVSAGQEPPWRDDAHKSTANSSLTKPTSPIAYDARTISRPDKATPSRDATLSQLRRDRGHHFDPRGLNAFPNNLAKIEENRANHADRTDPKSNFPQTKDAP